MYLSTCIYLYVSACMYLNVRSNVFLSVYRGNQQEKMARYCREIFGDLLLDDVIPNFPVSWSGLLTAIYSRLFIDYDYL